MRKDSPYPSYALGALLPIEGRVAWSMRVNQHTMLRATIGVCNDTHAWGLSPSWGFLVRFNRHSLFDGRPSFVKCFDSNVALPEGWPDGQFTVIMPVGGISLQEEYAVIEVIVDEGSLAFAINGDPPIRVPNFAFPPGARLRPWVQIFHSNRVSFTCPFVRCCASAE